MIRLKRSICLCVLKALLLSLLSALHSCRGQHWTVAAPASSQPAASVPRRQEPAAAVGRPHPERRAHLAAAQRQRSAQPPLHLRPQVWTGRGVIGHVWVWGNWLLILLKLPTEPQITCWWILCYYSQWHLKSTTVRVTSQTDTFKRWLERYRSIKIIWSLMKSTLF